MGGLGGGALVHLVPPAGFPLNPRGGRGLKGGGGLDGSRVHVVLGEEEEEEEEEVEEEEASSVSLQKIHQNRKTAVSSFPSRSLTHSHSLIFLSKIDNISTFIQPILTG